MYDIIIVGAGIAGMTAAIYGRRASKSVLVLEGASYGGQIINTASVENYPAAPHISGFDLASEIYNQAKSLGAEFKFEKVLKIKDGGTEKSVVTKKNSYSGKTVIIATGSENRRLGLENEKTLIGKGISYCATCDGAFYKDKTVAVVGGGNTALEDALYLSDIAQKVYLIHRRNTFRGEESTVEILRKKENVTFVYNSVVKKLNAGKRLESIEIENKNGNTETIAVNGLFVAIGRIPVNSEFSDLVELDGIGYIAASEDCRTNIPGIFAAGDNRTKEIRQLVTAAADGAVAASQAVGFIIANQTNIRTSSTPR